MDITVREAGGTPIVTVDGEVDVLTVPALRTSLGEALEDDHPRLVLDLSAVTFLDSTGLGVVAGCLKRARALGGDLAVVVESGSRVRQSFEVTGLARAIPVFDDLDAAIAHLSTN